jgi:hypothetical protein
MMWGNRWLPYPKRPRCRLLKAWRFEDDDNCFESESRKAENVPNRELGKLETEAQYVVVVRSRDYQRLKK